MTERAERIKEWIQARKERKETTSCVFYITVPKLTNAYLQLEDDSEIKKVIALLDKYDVTHIEVDSLPGAWNQDRYWIETGRMDCIVEFCGVYPIHWDPEDLVRFEQMEQEGKIIVQVDWVDADGNYTSNH